MDNGAMIDSVEITELIHQYATRLDAGDFDGVAALFEHATWRSGMTGEALRGSAEVRKVYERVRLYDGSPRTKHLITNLTIDIASTMSSATSSCYFTVLQGIEPGGKIEPILCGRYVDRFEKVEGRWRFADRLFLADLIGNLAGHFV
jgi:hypothetical protein